MRKLATLIIAFVTTIMIAQEVEIIVKGFVVDNAMTIIAQDRGSVHPYIITEHYGYCSIQMKMLGNYGLLVFENREKLKRLFDFLKRVSETKDEIDIDITEYYTQKASERLIVSKDADSKEVFIVFDMGGGYFTGMILSKKKIKKIHKAI